VRLLGLEGCHDWANVGENKEERFRPGESFRAEVKEVNKKGCRFGFQIFGLEIWIQRKYFQTNFELDSR
jgi:hypothetical protein